jgi:hypothetical protein
VVSKPQIRSKGKASRELKTESATHSGGLLGLRWVLKSLLKFIVATSHSHEPDMPVGAAFSRDITQITNNK